MFIKYERFIASTLKENLYIIEGIDIDKLNKTVSFNNEHENNVDTSILINPTYSKIDEYDVISIFKRKKSHQFALDGNPLIYALKGIKNWKFKNNKQDITNLLKQFIRICEKIQPSYNTIITVPSSNELNTNFLYRLNKIIKAENTITDYFHKLTAEEVYEDYIDWKQLYIDYSNNKENVEKDINMWFEDMVEYNNGWFSFKYIKDIKLRKYITKTMYSKDDTYIEYKDIINDKDILILDDTIGSGTTVSETCKQIIEVFSPKSITIITLFSKLDDKL